MSETLARLSARPETAAWLDALDAADASAGSGYPARTIDVPVGAALAGALRDFGVLEEDIGPIVAALPGQEDDPATHDLASRTARALVEAMGDLHPAEESGAAFAIPAWPAETGPTGRCFAIFAYAAALPHLRSYHRGHGVPDDVTRATVADLGRHVLVHRRRYGTVGLEPQGWLSLHLRGLLFQLGRLQFERATLWERLGTAVRAAGEPFGPGDPALSVHIPDFSGPLDPTACDAAFARAAAFFPRQFPMERHAVAFCASWLLDPHLAEVLPETSNIVRFQRRFQLAYRTEPDDESTVRFVFGHVPADLASLPRETTLQRAVLDHIAAGGHWRGGVGWVRVPDGN
ncbi:MAG: acyltransferase domain-containing protein [Chloroflexota bacterium]|nr:acyltransferase domain-containing protein [Chloroflexota bacterium]